MYIYLMTLNILHTHGPVDVRASDREVADKNPEIRTGF